MDNVSNNMLEVRGVYKSYDPENVIFKGLDMTVQRGTIYALLGPSGCGKSTLLKCILGRKHLDAGEIIIDIKDRSEIGYMPQDISLVGELTIKETFSYYGWIYQMTGHALEERKKNLFSTFDIPQENSKIKELSGGQKRRVSLCLALIHNPKLLILDEPTVGIDPILNQSIWEHLLELSTVQKKTIILTTQYIEEARHSNKVGMMRGGVLVVEGEPSSIMEHYGCDTLEEVFIQLSYKQELRLCESNKNEDDSPSPSYKPKLTLKNERLISLYGFIGFFLKNFYYLKHSSLGWFLLFFIPVSSTLTFQYSIGRPPVGLAIGIVNDELLQKHTTCENFSNVTCFPASCGYISLLEKRGIITVPYKDIDSARTNTGKQDIYGYIHFSENFTKSLFERIWQNSAATGSTLEESEINIWIDMSNKIIANFLKGTMYNLYFDYLDNLSLNCKWLVEHAKLPPIQFNGPVYGKSIPEFSEFSVPGILLMLEFFLPVAFVLPILQDKREGIIERSLILGLTNLEILLAYAAITLLLFSMQTVCNLVIFYGIYDHVFEGNLILALSLLGLVGISGMCFGMFVAVLCDRDLSAAMIVVGISIGSFFTSSLFWTSEGMHYILKSVCWLLPLTLSAEAYRAISSRSWPLSHRVVYNGFLSSTSWIFLFCFAAYVIIKIRKGIGHVN